ncbi:hypothetical protein [Tabrizicola fusiformis]|uniref:hypothetical protein n=1 Tax=Tabrizicola sp. SY72 TaxID=2741673 RepID=UPI001573AC34|nr:hypothetical protein [Tabrizicola sp. SY72]NTT87619.1 hypothetical protein [Tabrizicola sp. SY72]
MHVLSPVLVVSALAAMSVPVHALDAWTVGVERGMPTYALTTEAGEVRLVCDPDRVFGPTPNGALFRRDRYSQQTHNALFPSIDEERLFSRTIAAHSSPLLVAPSTQLVPAGSC